MGIFPWLQHGFYSPFLTTLLLISIFRWYVLSSCFRRMADWWLRWLSNMQTTYSKDLPFHCQYCWAVSSPGGFSVTLSHLSFLHSVHPLWYFQRFYTVMSPNRFLQCNPNIRHNFYINFFNNKLTQSDLPHCDTFHSIIHYLLLYCYKW